MHRAEVIKDLISIGISIKPPIMSYDDCIKRTYPHNNRCRFTTGFYCEDCGNFYKKGSNEYELHAGNLNPLELWIAYNNKAVEIYRKSNNAESEEYKKLIEKRNDFDDYHWDYK